MTEDNRPQAPKKKRRTLAERRAEMEEKLRQLEEKEAQAQLEESIKSGECADPKTAKECQKEIRYLKAAKGTLIKYELVDTERYNKVSDALHAKMRRAVEGE